MGMPRGKADKSQGIGEMADRSPFSVVVFRPDGMADLDPERADLRAQTPARDSENFCGLELIAARVFEEAYKHLAFHAFERFRIEADAAGRDALADELIPIEWRTTRRCGLCGRGNTAARQQRQPQSEPELFQ